MKRKSVTSIFHNLQLRYKLVVSFTFICLLSLLTFSIISITIYKDMIVKKTSDSMLDSMYSFKKGLNRYMDVIDRASIRLIYSPEVQAGIRTDLDKLSSEARLQGFLSINNKIQETINNSSGIYSLFIEDIYGNVFRTDISEFFVTSYLSSQDFKKLRLYEDAIELKGAAYWTIINLYSSQKTVALMRSINSAEYDHSLGMCIITISPGLLSEFLPKESSYNGTFCIVDQYGSIYNENSFDGIDAIVDMSESNNTDGYYERIVNNSKYVVTYTYNKDLKWYFVHFVDKSSLFKDLDFINRVWVIMFMVSFFLVAILSLIISKTISNPLTKLTGLFKEIEKGNLKVRFNSLYKDEIGILGQNFNEMVKKINEGIPLKREKLVRSILESNLDESEIRGMKEVFGIPFDDDFFQVVIINASSGITEAAGRKIENEIGKFEVSGFKIISITLKAGQYCVISNHSEEETLKLTEEMIRNIVREVDVKVRAFIGNSYNEPLLIKNSYEEAKALMKHRFYDKDIIFQSYECIDGQSCQAVYPDKFENRLVNYIDAGDEANCRNLIEELVVFMKENYTYPYIINIFISNIYAYVYKTLLKNGILPTDLFGSDCWDATNRKNQDEEPDGSFQDLLKIILLFIQHTRVTGSSGKIIHADIRKAVDIIDSEYHRPEMSMEFLAQRVHLHENYFCKLFKKEMEISFVDYLAGIRLDKAKKVLKETNGKIKEICHRVGFSDAHYFGIWFKENTGLTPSQFRKQDKLI